MAALGAAHEAELASLARAYGEPLTIDAPIHDGFDDPIRKPDRVGEVCFVVRRPTGRILLSIKRVYPRGAHRLPTGGIAPEEGILAALLREVREETGLEVAVTRFLARITYRPRSGGAPLFHTFAFLVEERGGTLGALDAGEGIEEYVEVAPEDLSAVADRLASLGEAGRGDIGGSWRHWGRFRAVVHRAVAEALAPRA